MRVPLLDEYRGEVIDLPDDELAEVEHTIASGVLRQILKRMLVAECQRDFNAQIIAQLTEAERQRKAALGQ